MKYRLSVASLAVSSYGDRFDPVSQAPMTMLAKNLDRAKDIQKELDKCVADWRSAEVAPSDAAMKAALALAIQEVGGNLNKNLGAPYSLVGKEEYYVPVVDKDGKIIGHDTAAWIMLGTDYLFKQTSTLPKIGMWGCVLLGVIPE
jgi:hypothetical protein